MQTNVGEADVVAVGCGTDDGPPIVFFYGFADVAVLAAVYGEPAAVPVDCLTVPPDFLGESTYTRPDGTTGRLRCGINTGDRFFLIWTDDTRTVMGAAFGDDAAQMASWWQRDAGLD